MSSTRGRHETLLNHLTSEWCAGRGNRLEPLLSPEKPSKGTATESGLKVEGPGAIFRWNDDGEPIAITLLTPGSHTLADQGHRHHLTITVTPHGLELDSTMGARSSLPTHEPTLQHGLDECIATIRDHHPDESHDTLTKLLAAQQLAALGQRLTKSNTKLEASSRGSAREQFATDLHAWLDGQLENSVKLADVGREFGKSPRQIIRILKETTGTGFSEHLTMHRLILARQLLMRTADSVMEVARKSGFNSREQFIRSFNKAFGWTPLQFRKAWNQASLASSSLAGLCRIDDRCEVRWLDEETPGEPSIGKQAHTLIVANALHDIVELFRLDGPGQRERFGVLERGSMVFIHRDLEGSRWLIRSPGSGLEWQFATPAQHAIAVTPES